MSSEIKGDGGSSGGGRGGGTGMVGAQVVLFRFSRIDLVPYLGRGHFFSTRQMLAFVLNIWTTFVFLN